MDTFYNWATNTANSDVESEEEDTAKSTDSEDYVKVQSDDI